VSVEEAEDVLVGGAPQDGRAADLVAVELEDGKDGSVAYRVEKADALPRCLERPGLRLAVPDDARHQQVGIVEGGTKRVSQRVAQLAALVDGARCRHAHMAGDASRGRELPDQTNQAGLVQ
jgi:hypothetical protein